ncbi:MAG: hypothetical protein IKK96_01265 [Lachnospiraceae bacterium]|nr:hypothetical protein [Lachnospiraceae bacterium]
MEDNRGKTDVFFQGIHASQIPIVVLDERWHQMFNVIEKPKLVKDLEDEVNALLKKQGQVNNDLKEVKKIKNKLMQEIVEQMEVSGENSEKNQKRNKTMEKNQKLILECNEKLEALEDEQFEIPHKLRDANEKLIVAGMEIAYIHLQKGKEEEKRLTNWIAKARIELRKQMLLKQETEDNNVMIYNNMHDILGAQLMEVLDNKFGQKE